MCIGKQIDNFWQARINQTRNVIDDYNRLQIEVGKLESVSGFSIESLIKMFAEGYELKKNSRKEAGIVRVMISQPMANRTEEDVRQERKAIIEKFNNMHIDVIDTIFTDEVPIDYNAGVYYLGKSIKEMSKADALFMCDGWREARGCRIEYQVAREYGIKILYEDFFINKPELGTRTL